MTVLEAIQRSSDFLSRKGVESPRLNAELLLSHVLRRGRIKLYLDFESPLAEVDVDRLRELVKRRGQREPLQHITGTACFCGLDLAVNRNVLVPRPETEILAECGWKFLAQAMQTNPAPKVLDFGTGSGCIAAAIAMKCPGASIIAADKSEEALMTAKANAERLGLCARIHFVRAAGVVEIPGTTTFDLIISNPPYIATQAIDTLQPEVRNFDPREALDGGPDGLDFYRMLARDCPARLRGNGRVMLEIGDGQDAAVQEIFRGQNWIVESVAEDYTQRPRVLIVQKNG